MNKELISTGSKDLVDDRIGPAVVSLLLDETGSMIGIKNQTISGFNQFLLRAKAEFFGEDVLMNFVTFSQIYGNNFRVRQEHESIFKQQVLTHGDYLPTGQTNLIDSCMRMIKLTEETLEGKPGRPLVTVIFQTDGNENASSYYSMTDLRAKIDKCRAKGWKFILLGAGVDNRRVADLIGIDPNNRLTYDRRSSSEQAFIITARKLVNFVKSKGTDDSGFTKEDREQVGETRLLGFSS